MSCPYWNMVYRHGRKKIRCFEIKIAISLQLLEGFYGTKTNCILKPPLSLYMVKKMEKTIKNFVIICLLYSSFLHLKLNNHQYKQDTISSTTTLSHTHCVICHTCKLHVFVLHNFVFNHLYIAS